MTKKQEPKPDFKDYGLSTRAIMALKNLQPGGITPTGLLDGFAKDYDATVIELLRIPNCGRMTVNEIIDLMGVERPKGAKVDHKLIKFKDEAELLEYLKDFDGLDPDKAERAVMVMIVSLMSRKLVQFEKLDPPSGRIILTADGDEELDRVLDERPATLTVKGSRRQIRELIEGLQDNHPYLDQLEDCLQELESNHEGLVVLKG